MWNRHDSDQFADELYLAGELVPQGTYKQVGTGREVRLDREDFLPASLDGRVACYTRVGPKWVELLSRHAA